MHKNVNHDSLQFLIKEKGGLLGFFDRFLMGGLALHDDLRFALEINTTMKGFFHHIYP